MSSSSVISVVCALIERDGQVLVAQRPPHKHLPLKWEFPGGKVETGEDPATALEREIQEELGCRLVNLTRLPSSFHEYPDRTIEMLPFLAQLAPGSPEPHAHEHVALKWVEPAELLTIDLAGADLPILANYLARLGVTGAE
jgi:8-oxo-dGTP diphosphatase